MTAVCGRWRCLCCRPRCAHLLCLGWRRWIQSSSWLLPRLRCWPLALGEGRRDCGLLLERRGAPIIITISRDGRFAGAAGRSRRHELDYWVSPLHRTATEASSSSSSNSQGLAGSRRLVFLGGLAQFLIRSRRRCEMRHLHLAVVHQPQNLRKSLSLDQNPCRLPPRITAVANILAGGAWQLTNSNPARTRKICFARGGPTTRKHVRYAYMA